MSDAQGEPEAFQVYVQDAITQAAASLRGQMRAWLAAGGTDDVAEAAIAALGAAAAHDPGALEAAGWRIYDLMSAEQGRQEAETRRAAGSPQTAAQKRGADMLSQLEALDECVVAIKTIADCNDRFQPRACEDCDPEYTRELIAEALGALPAPPPDMRPPALPDGMIGMGTSKAAPKPFGSLLPGLADLGDLGVIYGHPGAGKSFCGVSLSCSLVTGRAIFGAASRPCVVVYLAPEGGARFPERVAAWHTRHGGDLSHLIVSTDAINLTSPDDVNALLTRLRGVRRSLALPIAAVFIDTLTAAMGGADDSLGTNMGAFLQACRRIQATGAAVVAVHHKNKSGNEMRGHGSLNAACSLAIDVTASKVGSVARIMKLREGPIGAAFPFRIAAEGSTAVADWKASSPAVPLNATAGDGLAALLAGNVAIAAADGRPLRVNGAEGVYKRRGELSFPLRSLGRDPLAVAVRDALAAGLIRNVRGTLTASQ